MRVQSGGTTKNEVLTYRNFISLAVQRRENIKQKNPIRQRASKKKNCRKQRAYVTTSAGWTVAISQYKTNGLHDQRYHSLVFQSTDRIVVTTKATPPDLNSICNIVFIFYFNQRTITKTDFCFYFAVYKNVVEKCNESL